MNRFNHNKIMAKKAILKRIYDLEDHIAPGRYLGVWNKEKGKLELKKLSEESEAPPPRPKFPEGRTEKNPFHIDWQKIQRGIKTFIMSAYPGYGPKEKPAEDTFRRDQDLKKAHRRHRLQRIKHLLLEGGRYESRVEVSVGVICHVPTFIDSHLRSLESGDFDDIVEPTLRRLEELALKIENDLYG